MATKPTAKEALTIVYHLAELKIPSSTPIVYDDNTTVVNLGMVLLCFPGFSTDRVIQPQK